MSGMGLVGIGLGVGGPAILAWTALARTPAPPSRPTAERSPSTAPLSPGTASPFPGTAPLLLRAGVAGPSRTTRPGGGRPTCSGRRRDPGAAGRLVPAAALCPGSAPGQGGGGSRPGHPGRPLGGAGGQVDGDAGAGVGGGGGRAHPGRRDRRLGRRGGGGAAAPDQRVRVCLGLDRRPAGRPGHDRRAGGPGRDPGRPRLGRRRWPPGRPRPDCSCCSVRPGQGPGRPGGGRLDAGHPGRAPDPGDRPRPDSAWPSARPSWAATAWQRPPSTSATPSPWPSWPCSRRPAAPSSLVAVRHATSPLR